MNLVVFKNGQAFCDSSMVAKKIGKKHAYISDNIVSVIEKLKMLRVGSTDAKVEPYTKEYRGQSFTAYLMNREFFSLLMMQFRGQKSFEWQVKFNNAFYEMEERILKDISNKSDSNFIEAREQSKISRREETDVIKDFVEYATKQGSKNAKFYYSNITKATYRALELMVQKKPKLRDTLDIYQLSELLLAERVAKNSLKKYMELGRDYKDVYKCVAEDLTAFGNSLKLN